MRVIGDQALQHGDGVDARFFHARQECRRVDRVQHGQGHGGGQRVAAVGGAVGADGQRLRQFIRGQHGADRVAVAQGLGGRQDVRRDAVAHVGEQRASAAHAALDFVENQQGARLVAQGAQLLEELRIARHHAAFALYRLDDHCAHVIADGGACRFDVVVGDVVDRWRQRLEAFRVLGLAADGDRKQGAAVEGAEARDDARLVRSELGVRVLARQLQGRFVGFRARVAEEGAVGEGRFRQRQRQAQDRLVGVAVAQMPQIIDLLGQHVDQRRMAVTEAVDGDAGGEIEVMLA
ncbi:hypothetical protein D3C72_1268570 [compost metagenome]